MWIQISDIYLGIYIGFIIHSFSRVVSISFLPEALQKASELGESEGEELEESCFSKDSHDRVPYICQLFNSYLI